MRKRLDITDDERAQINTEIAHFGMFIEDIVADPSVLDQLPDEAHVDAIPKEERDPSRRYDAETARMVVTVSPARQEDAERRKPA